MLFHQFLLVFTLNFVRATLSVQLEKNVIPIIQRETGQFERTIDWLKCIICQEETSKKPECPANSKRHDSGAGHVTFERDQTSFYEVGELHLAVNWECLNEGNGIASTLTSHFALWHKSCRDAFNRTKLKRIIKRKMPEESHGQSSSNQTRSSMFPESMKRTVCFFL